MVAKANDFANGQKRGEQVTAECVITRGRNVAHENGGVMGKRECCRLLQLARASQDAVADLVIEVNRAKAKKRTAASASPQDIRALQREFALTASAANNAVISLYAAIRAAEAAEERGRGQ